ncbi:putative metal-dependent hydrolase YjjV [Paraglaciecola mesophila]|uniref:Putative metal-dependent hydrolase YjjV n=1 Tax=Paraglaciecola mesophila TaxID=197222 RepID=A0A857JQ35_9ALTE|nr:TatD family hydrolase [Paraglaciecola mesophila]QHJ13502.1 putative metal-dependent hydrolase YjjV [Paraglaciecola mesophila]
MIDSHCHLNFSAFNSDRKQVLQTCTERGVSSLVIPGTQANSWDNLISLCKRSTRLNFALGLHPYFLDDYCESHLQQLDELLTLQKGHVVAVGEIGLDFSLSIDSDLQEQVFAAQICLAEQHDLPIIVHHRRSHNALIRILKEKCFGNGGIIHAFSGSFQEAQTYIELGFKLGVGGIITYPRAKKTRAVIAKVPLTSLVLETDAPDMPINNKQGQRNSPIYLPIILEALQALRCESAEVVKQACWQNTLDILANIKR